MQYQHGLPLLDFFEEYGSAQRCEELVRGWRWPGGFVCPCCAGVEHSEFRRCCRLYFQCSGCRYQSSLVAGTIFESTKLSLPKWFVAMHLMTQAKNNVSALELKRHLGASSPTAWLMKHKIMEVMRRCEDSRELTGRVEIDDTYLGGEYQGGKPGRGSPNKVSFVAAVQTTETGAPVLACFSRRPFTKESIQDFAAKSLAAPATLVSDGLGRFTAIRGTGILHEQHVTGGGPGCVEHPLVSDRQHRSGQPEDGLRGHLPCLRIRQILASVSRSGSVPVQSALQPQDHSPAARPRRMHNLAVPTSDRAGG